MSTFKDYLTESAKSYDYKIKVAGMMADDFASKLESALAKFEVANMSAGKKTPIMTLPLDFPALSNEEVTIFDVTTNYPVSVNVLPPQTNTAVLGWCGISSQANLEVHKTWMSPAREPKQSFFVNQFEQ